MRDLEQCTPSIRVAHRYRFPSHRNTAERNRFGYCYAFHYVLEGKGSIIIDGEAFELRRGHLVYIPAMKEHSFYTDSDHPLITDNMYCDLWSDYPIVTPHHLAWSENQIDTRYVTPIHPCFALEQLVPVMPLAHDSLLPNLFTHLVLSHGRKEPSTFGATSGRHLLMGWLLELCSHVDKTSRLDRRIQAVMERMEVSPGQPVETWLEESGLGKSQFHHLFKQATGMSSAAYQERVLMQRAAAALRESRMNVTEIADSLGYSSVHYFSKRFTRYFGVSPLGYRRPSEKI